MMIGSVVGRLANFITFILKTSVLSYIIKNAGSMTFLFLPPLYLHFAHIFPKKIFKDSKRNNFFYYFIIYIPAFIFSYIFFYVKYEQLKNIKILFGFYEIAYILFMNIIFYRSYKIIENKIDKKKVLFVSIGLNLNIVFISLITYMNMMYFHKFSITSDFLELFSPAIIFIFVGVPLLNFNLKNIFIVIRKSMLWALFMIFILSFYIFIKKNIEYTFKSFKIAEWFLEGVIVIVIVFVFQPLKNIIINVVDKIIIEKRDHLVQSLKDFSAVSVNILDINELVIIIKKLILETFDSEKVDIILFKNSKTSNNEYKNNEYKTVYVDENKFNYNENTFLDDINEIITNTDNDEYNDFITTQPILFQNTLIGILRIGKKITGEDYTIEEIGIIYPLVNQIAVSLANAISYEKLKIANIKLNKTIEELEQTKDKLYEKDKLASLGRMSASIAHEIRNPLGIIKLSSGKLKEKIEDNKYKELAGFIESEVDRLNSIVQGLLDFSAERQINLETVEIRGFLENICNKLEKFDNISVQIKLKILETYVKIDKEAFYQVILNLYINAIQAIGNKGNIYIRLLKDKNNVLVNIEDSGKGIDKETEKKIFEPFFTTKTRGNGLGLSVVKQIIEKHNGKIKYYRNNNRTIFSIILKEMKL